MCEIISCICRSTVEPKAPHQHLFSHLIYWIQDYISCPWGTSPSAAWRIEMQQKCNMCQTATFNEAQWNAALNCKHLCIFLPYGVHCARLNCKVYFKQEHYPLLNMVLHCFLNWHPLKYIVRCTVWWYLASPRNIIVVFQTELHCNPLKYIARCTVWWYLAPPRNITTLVTSSSPPPSLLLLHRAAAHFFGEYYAARFNLLIDTIKFLHLLTSNP